MNQSESKGEEEDQAVASSPIPKSEELKMIYARNFINKVDKNFKQKDTLTKNVRHEIVQCKQRMRDLEIKRDETLKRLDQAQNENNM